jgi:hypothetical protein
MAHLMTDDELDRRLRSSAPAIDSEPDLELLERVTATPRAPLRRRRSRALVPVAAIAAAAVLAFVILSGSRPEEASAISQALRWFDPPAGTILHSRTVDTSGGVREVWQDVNDPSHTRMIEADGRESAPGAFYDPSTNTIYLDDPSGRPSGNKPVDGKKAEELQRRGSSVKLDPLTQSGDPIVIKIRTLLADGRAVVRGREAHDGVDAWAITLGPDADRQPWTLWVRADDGKPIALEDPGDPARGRDSMNVRWTDYEVLDKTDEPLTIREAHPDAHVVRDVNAFDLKTGRQG